MEEHKDSIKSLFKKMVEGKSTPAERLQLLTWLENNPSAEEFPAVEDLPDAGNKLLMPASEADRVWHNILRQTDPTPVVPLWKRSGLKIAAALVPVIGIASLVLFFYNRRDQQQYFVNNTHYVQTIQLKDGSTIQLKQHSRVTVAFTHGYAGKREVWLQGEAFFNVQQQAAHPFTVHASNGVDIQVLGTAFNVNTEETHTAVVLNAGSVSVKAAKAHKPVALQLKPGEMASFDANTRVLSAEKVDTLFHTSWKYNLMAFKNESLKQVMHQLGEQYGYHVAFENAIQENLLFTGYLPTDNLRQAILTIEQSFNLKIDLQQKSIYIKNKSF
ncbi:FecR family protein [Chitinophaga eiseniae]|uniref:DUF4974 domain-containing protein n=1 Tax=Chitinophaga eiseniae TaxID=634771 RepID=A0A847SHS4_9BACT|nr:FecR domain-containing protein [Chitinophaga eiseniae]NLR79694.1 DUF4974 domain-containing protein [Chitinophaga eiseniae]